MLKNDFLKVKKYLAAILGISIFSAFAQKLTARAQILYGVPQPLYGVPNPPVTDFVIFERLFVYIILPFSVLLILIVGLVIFIRNRIKKNVQKNDQKNIQKRGS